MALLWIFSISLFGLNVLSSGIPRPSVKPERDLELKLVHVIFRHGQRVPADTYPLDPYVDNDFAPYGWGQLTNKGRFQMYDNGRFLRNRYNAFLGNTFNLDVRKFAFFNLLLNEKFH